MQIIVSEGRRLALLIDDFLDIAKIEAGSFELHITQVLIPELVKETLAGINMPENLKLATKFEENFPEIPGDKNRIKQVILNIVGNAMKYSPDGGEILIEAKTGPDSVTLSVKDNGPGISETKKAKIFDRFYRGDDELAVKTRGSGLGLPIAKAIVESHNGKLWVESEAGKGSTFFFTFPRGKGERHG